MNDSTILRHAVFRLCTAISAYWEIWLLYFVSVFQKLYTEAWDEDKTMYYPYSDSPELRRVAKAQEVLSDVSTPYFLSAASFKLKHYKSHNDL